MNDSTNEARERDAAAMRILSAFFLTLGSLVLVGTFWTLDNARGIIVSLASSAALLGIGAFMLRFARRDQPRR